MPCCGSKRTVARQFFEEPFSRATPVRPAPPSVEFEYVGTTTLRTVGPATQRDYWFGQPGARVWVDGRDARSLDGIPKLVRVRLAR
jgi:hypothetical protein